MITRIKAFLFSTVRNRILAGLFIVVPLGVSLWIGYFVFDKLTQWGVTLLGLGFEALDNAGFTKFNYLSLHINDLWIQVPIRIGSLFIIFSALFFIGQLAKWTIGKKLIAITDYIMKKVPMLNTIYTTIQQIGEAIWSPTGGMFRQVVLFEYPRRQMWVIGFLTNENQNEWELSQKTGEELYSVFLPTTPNPTSGFLLFIPKKDCILLDMDIAEGMRLVISGGAVPPPGNSQSVMEQLTETLESGNEDH